MRALAAVLAALSLLAASTSCARTVAVAGHASPAGDPSVKTGQSDPISELVPGSPIMIGSGSDTRVCTAGWVVGMTGQLEGRVGLLAAGRCAPNKAEVKVRFVPPGKSTVVDGAAEVLVGHVVAGGPLTDVPAKPDISIIWVTEDPKQFGNLGVRPNAHVPIAKNMVDSPTLWIDRYGAPQLCWAYGATHPELNVAKTACGTARTGTNSTFTVLPDDASKITSDQIGAPAWIRAGAKMGNVIAGIVTSVDKGMVTITGINSAVKRIPANICLDVPANGAGCVGPDLTQPMN